MLSQYKIKLKTGTDFSYAVKPEWGFYFYSELLQHVAPAFADFVHSSPRPPVCQYLSRENDKAVWIVSVMGIDNEKELCGVIETCSEYRIKKLDTVFKADEITVKRYESPDELFYSAARLSDRIHLNFVTPAAFKSSGVYVNIPSSRLIIRSLINKWNESISECPIDIEDEESLLELENGLNLRLINLKGSIFHLKGAGIPGFTGTLEAESRAEGFNKEFIKAMLLFSEFSGVGIKTALGMGGVRVKG